MQEWPRLGGSHYKREKTSPKAGPTPRGADRRKRANAMCSVQGAQQIRAAANLPLMLARAGVSAVISRDLHMHASLKKFSLVL